MADVTALPKRRLFLRHGATALAGLGVGAFFDVPGLFAEQLRLTPPQTEGPFYPNHLPLDTDNDLLVLNDGLTPAVGEVTHLSGRILDASGQPIRNALVEIWQVDANGVYIHTADTHAARDKHFQGFGRFLTGSSGEYYFRTIKPVSYPGRTPHIHVAIKMKGREKWTTQCYIKGEPRNAADGVLRATEAGLRDLLMADFVPVKGSAIGELAARFDVVMGHTPAA